MIDMSSQIIIDCCYLCFSELLEIKENPRVRFARLFVSACLPIMRTQTPENSGRFVLKRFVSLSGHLKTEAFESEREKFVT